MSEPESEPSLVDREVRAVHALERFAADRVKSESDTERGFRHRRDEDERAYQANKGRVTTTARADTTETKAKYQSVRDSIAAQADAQTTALQSEYAEVKRVIVGKSNGARNSAKKKMEEVKWQALAIFEAGKDEAIKKFKQRESEVRLLADQIEALKEASTPTVRRVRRFAPKTVEPVAPLENSDQPIEALTAVAATAQEQHAAVDRLFLPKALALPALVPPFLLLAVGIAFLLGPKVGWGLAAGIGVGAGVGAGVAVFLALASLARKQVARLYPPFNASLDEADRLINVSKQWTKTTLEQDKDAVERKRVRDAEAADAKFAVVVAEIEQRRDAALKEADAKFPPLIQGVADRRAAAVKEADDVYPRRLEEIQQRFRREIAALDEAVHQSKEATDREYADAWRAIRDHWSGGLAEVAGDADFVNAAAARQHLDWHRADLDAWQPPTVAPAGLQFGMLNLDLKNIPQGMPADARLQPFGPTKHALPALTPFPRKGSVLIKAADAGKAEAVNLLQTLMLRYLTSLPPGKVRFTIIDPIGLGENFAAFMHLADYSELLVTSRIWTETPQIEQRLADISAHMENVIQKYLRNEFETIEDYNIHAGEVAEPFRVIVVANFPANFSETAARRLVSIATSGSRCGVYTLISLDTKQTLPTGVQLKDLEPFCVNFQWREGALRWQDRELAKLPLTYDTPPPQDRFSALLHKVGELAKNANRVEVPFDFIAPTRENYWTANSARGIDVPLGRAGATKLQHLKLGKGTSQHVLIAGKTGSGKSTLLHALIVNTALRYSPDEVEMYLIDFKKGVEFKVYAALELPHARVIAVESEREFGLSVLQRLDGELKARGDRFRDLGVQDLGSYRDADGGKNPLPRILFIVDEFQEFFVEDDKIAQDVALLLDRLVRQGRAFGIHVHLGSQSLGGAYSLARSTIGQMAVRIALQCSESDAHLILSEENSAARLLTRPGEAIYNDQNGMVEGNNFFQVVWLTDERREEYLHEIRALAASRNRPPASQIVFEGNLPAVAAKNLLMSDLLTAPGWPEPPKADYAWLGDAIAIKDPTSAVFRPQSGSNLLIVGQNDEMALGIFEMAIYSLAAQHDPSGVGFYLFDAIPADSALAGRFAKVKDVIPHAVHSSTQRDLPNVIGAIAAEVERRQKADEPNAPNLYLFILDLSRLRDLRKSDDDFGFSGGYGGGAKVDPPSKHFGNILRDGPPVGVHTLVWCDSLNNLNRSFDRQGLKEFELRVLFQMSANDSSTLIDGPTASRLGANRALFLSEEEGRLEKFRPYGLAPTEWLDEVRDRLGNRASPAPIDLPTIPPTAPAVSETADAGGFGAPFPDDGWPSTNP